MDEWLAVRRGVREIFFRGGVPESLVREDAGFHAYRILEAGVRQFEGMGQEQQGAQTPTCRPPCSGVGTALFRPPCYHPNAVRE